MSSVLICYTFVLNALILLLNFVQAHTATPPHGNIEYFASVQLELQQQLRFQLRLFQRIQLFCIQPLGLLQLPLLFLLILILFAEPQPPASQQQTALALKVWTFR